MPYSPDDFLKDLQGGVQNYASSAEGLRKQAAQQLLVEHGPALAQSGNFGEIASLAAGAGDMTLLRQLLENKTKPLAAGLTITSQDIQNVAQLQGIKPSAEAAASAAKFGKSAVGLISGARSGEQFNTTDARLTAKQQMEQKNKVYGAVSKLEADFDEETRQVQNILRASERGTQPDFNIVRNYIVRAIAKEKGPLSEGDLQRSIARTLGVDINELKNYLTGSTDSSFSPEQKKVLTEIVLDQAKNINGYYSNKMSTLLSDQRGVNPQAFENGLGKILDRKLQKFGLEKKSEDGLTTYEPKKGKNDSGLQANVEEKGAMALDLDVFSGEPDFQKEVAAKIQSIKNFDKAKAYYDQALQIFKAPH